MTAVNLIMTAGFIAEGHRRKNHLSMTYLDFGPFIFGVKPLNHNSYHHGYHNKK